MARDKIKHPVELSASLARKYRSEIAALAARKEAQEELRRTYRDYFPDKPLGRAICESYPNEELSALLAERASELGHPPSQSELFCLYRAYIKHRFSSWPAALRSAGLRQGTCEVEAELDWPRMLRDAPEVGRSLLALSERWRTTGVPPVRRTVAQHKRLAAAIGDWNHVLAAARGLDRWLEDNPTSLSEPEPQHLNALRALAGQLGRTPLREETSEPLRLSLRLGYGSWGAALSAAGLPRLGGEEAAQARWECQQRQLAGTCMLFFIQTPTAQQRYLLTRLERLCQRLGRSPLREEVPGPLWDSLLTAFGSWRNSLFQLRRAPLTGAEAHKLRGSLRSRGKM